MNLDGHTFGLLLDLEGSRQGKEQKDLAKHLGISSGAISQWKNSTVPNKHLDGIAAFFGFTGEDDLLAATKAIDSRPVYVVEDPIYLNEILAEIFRTRSETILSRAALMKTAREHNLTDERIIEALSEHPDPSTRLLASLLTPNTIVRTGKDLIRWQRLARNAILEMGYGLEFQVVVSSLADYFSSKDAKCYFGFDDILTATGVNPDPIWDEVLALPFVIRESNAKWVLRLRFPSEEETAEIYNES